MAHTERWTSSGVRGAAIFALEGLKPDAPTPSNSETQMPRKMEEGPLPVLALGEAERPYGKVGHVPHTLDLESEKSDRSRAFDPHLMDLLDPPAGENPPRWRRHLWVDSACLPKLRDAGIAVSAVEELRILYGSERDTIKKFSGGARAEVTQVIAVLHFSFTGDPAEALSALTSRDRQDILRDVRRYLAPLGHLRREKPHDLTFASEMPFVIISVITEPDDDPGKACSEFRDGPEAVLTAGKWTVATWPDLAVLAARRDEKPNFRLGRGLHTVALSVLLDAAVLRFAQREVLGALVRRAAQSSVGPNPGGVGSESDPQGELHRVSLRVRSRLWWPTVGSLSFVRAFADQLSRDWVLAELAQSADTEIQALAEQARRDAEVERARNDQRQLENDRRVGDILMVFTIGAVGLSFVSLLMAIITSRQLTAAIVGGLGVAVVAATVSWYFYSQVRRLETADRPARLPDAAERTSPVEGEP